MKINEFFTGYIQLDLALSDLAPIKNLPLRRERQCTPLTVTANQQVAVATKSSDGVPAEIARPQGKAKVLIVGDDPLFSLGLSSLLNSEADLTVCGKAHANEAVLAIARTQPDAVVVNISTPEHIEAIKSITKSYPALPILAYSTLTEVTFPERALRAGAKGFVSKQQPLEATPNALRTVLRGCFAVNAELEERMFGVFLGLPQPNTLVDNLSDRELSVFYHLGEGLTTREIAEAMGITMHTIWCFYDHLKSKLCVKNKPSLTRMAVEWVNGLDNSLPQ